MIRPAHPYIIVVEASGLGPNSYPIEVGLALEPDQRFCTLIRPADHWNHWDDQAESMHKISRENLLKNGRLVIEVALQLNRLLRNKVVFSDACRVDNPWIIELYATAGIEKALRISALEMILTEQQIELWLKTRDSVVLDLGGEIPTRCSRSAWIPRVTAADTFPPFAYWLISSVRKYTAR